MATKSDRPGLLSKMAMFVRNPTKDWSELDRPQAEQDSGYDKQVLKQMIERKRQNDFIRKREFDQLRKLRSRGVSAVAGTGRPSVFQSSMATDPDGRAVTLKKIDEIEAQMSKQWWKGKQDAANGQGGSFPVAGGAPVHPDAMAPTRPASFDEQFDASGGPGHSSQAPGAAEFSATEMGDGMEPAPQAPPARPSAGKIPIMGSLAQSYDGVEVGFSTSKLFAIDVDDVASDPELEEAAIRFANGDDEGAEGGLLDALRADAADPQMAALWAVALLDLYRVTQDQARFEQAVAEFSHRFDGALPQWGTPGKTASVVPVAPAATASAASHAEPAPDYSAGAIWVSPSALHADSMEQLRDAMASNPTPWHLDWTRLEYIEDDAGPLLAGLFGSLCDEPVALRFSGASHLVNVLRTMMPSGDQSVDPQWWTMRLNALRTMKLQDDFELAALDYCVTYEVSPPGWHPARCAYENVEAGDAPAARIEATGWGSGFSQMSTVPVNLEGSHVVHVELTGSVLGDASQLLASFDAAGTRGDTFVVSCKGLLRVDFSAAGSILNWVAMRQAEGSHVQFREVHHLVAAFFNVIGINEHARVVPRAT